MDPITVGTISMWVGVVSGTTGFIASRLDDHQRIVERAAATSLVASLVAIGALGLGLLAVDTSMATVVTSTSRATPWPYRLAGVWGTNEASLLSFSTLLLAWGWVGTRRDHRAMGVVAGLGAVLLALGAAAASPFARLVIPATDGDGLLAILQHPAMIYHPPILYSGLTVLVVPFALVASGHTDPTRVFRWSIMGWTLLVIGMAAGSHWAYAELGWGGLWAWDPIENTSLIPWLVVTAFLHARSSALAALPFPLTLLGAGLTRSGVTGSVHSFADGGAMAIAFPLLAAVALVVVWRRRDPTDRDVWRRTAIVLTLAAAAATTVGTAWPLVSEFVLDRPLAMDPKFFVTLMAPIAAVALVGMVVAFSAGHPPARVAAIWVVAILGGALLAPDAGGTPIAARVLFTLAVGTAVVMAVDLTSTRRPPHAVVAHLGMAVVLVGLAATAMGSEFRGAMEPGDTADLGGTQLVLRGIATGTGDRWISVEAEFDLVQDERITTIVSEIRAYEAQPLPIPEPVVVARPSADIVVALSRVTEDAGLVFVNAFRRPLVSLVWMGAGLLVVAGALAGRTAAAAVPRRSATATPPQP